MCIKANLLNRNYFMGGSRSFDSGGSHIEKARDDGNKVALDSLKSWLIGGAMAQCPPPRNRP